MNKIKIKLLTFFFVFCVIFFIKNISLASWVAADSFVRGDGPYNVASCQHYWSPEVVKPKKGSKYLKWKKSGIESCLRWGPFHIHNKKFRSDSNSRDLSAKYFYPRLDVNRGVLCLQHYNIERRFWYAYNSKNNQN